MARKFFKPAGPPQEFLGYVVEETIKAFFFQSWYWKEPIWMPKSQVTVTWGDYEVKLVASGWISDQNNLKEETYEGTGPAVSDN